MTASAGDFGDHLSRPLLSRPFISKHNFPQHVRSRVLWALQTRMRTELAGKDCLKIAAFRSPSTYFFAQRLLILPAQFFQLQQLLMIVSCTDSPLQTERLHKEVPKTSTLKCARSSARCSAGFPSTFAEVSHTRMMQATSIEALRLDNIFLCQGGMLVGRSVVGHFQVTLHIFNQPMNQRTDDPQVLLE